MDKKHKVVLATQNQHKLREIKEILKDFPFHIFSMEEVGLTDLEVVEDQETFEGNSLKKAVEVMKACKSIAIADDSGLEVDALDSQPGVYSARFSGEGATDEKNNQKLLAMLKDKPLEERQAKFVSVISVAFPDGRSFSVRGECHGSIGFEEKGCHGFGYDPLFIVPEFNKSFGELDGTVKNKISHRARALEKLREKLEMFF